MVIAGNSRAITLAYIKGKEWIEGHPYKVFIAVSIMRQKTKSIICNTRRSAFAGIFMLNVVRTNPSSMLNSIESPVTLVNVIYGPRIPIS